MELSTTQARDRRLFLLSSVLFIAVALIGFARTYYFRGYFGGLPLRTTLVGVHGALMTAWVGLFATQVWLIRSGNRRTHRLLGWAGVGLGVAIVAVGFLVAAHAAKYGSPSFPPEFTPMQFAVVPLVDLMMFVGLFGAAVYFRKNAANHKRLMLLTIINFLPPALARFPGETIHSLGPVVFNGVPVLLMIGLLIADRRVTGRFNRAMLVGSVLLIASYPIRIAISTTGAWLHFMTWVTNWVA
jgi:hypothetical protein